MKVKEKLLEFILWFVFLPLLFLLSHFIEPRLQFRWDAYLTVCVIEKALECFSNITCGCRPDWFQWKVFYPLITKVHDTKWKLWESLNLKRLYGGIERW